MSEIKKQYITSDISLAAYLKLKGLVLINFGKADKFNFVFDDSEGLAKGLAIEFVNSDMRKYDDEIRSLKKLLYPVSKKF